MFKFLYSCKVELDLTELESLELMADKLESEDCEDFTVELEGAEYRFISSKVIDDVYYFETVDLIKDSYNLEVPHFIEIDWDKTVENCKVDGFGHHFSSYDGSEVYVSCSQSNMEYYIFRTN